MVKNEENLDLTLNRAEFEKKTGFVFEDYYKKYRPKLHWFLSQLCKSSADVEDMLTDSFITALKKIEQYDPERGAFSTWHFIMAKRLMINKMSKSNSKQVSLDQDWDGSTMGDFLMDEPDNSAYTRALAERKARIVLAAMPQLGEKHRRVLEMREIENRSYEEISAITKTNLSTTKSQIRQARLKLKSLTEESIAELEAQYEV